MNKRSISTILSLLFLMMTCMGNSQMGCSPNKGVGAAGADGGGDSTIYSYRAGTILNGDNRCQAHSFKVPTSKDPKDDKTVNSIECKMNIGDLENWQKTSYIKGKMELKDGKPVKIVLNPWSFSGSEENALKIGTSSGSRVWVRYDVVPGNVNVTRLTENEALEVGDFQKNPLSEASIEDKSINPNGIDEVKKVGVIVVAAPQKSSSFWDITLRTGDGKKDPYEMLEMTTSSKPIFKYAIEVLKSGNRANVTFFGKSKKETEDRSYYVVDAIDTTVAPEPASNGK